VQAIQQMLGEVGLKVTIAMSDSGDVPAPPPSMPQDAGSLSIGRWSCACQDADGVIQPLFHSASTWAKYNNAVYDEAVEKARATPRPTVRLAWYRKPWRSQGRRSRHRSVPGCRDLWRAQGIALEASGR